MRTITVVVFLFAALTAFGQKPFDVQPANHECFFRDDLTCDVPKTTETDIFGCEANGYYTNVHRAYFPAGSVIRVSVQSSDFRPFVGISKAGQEDYYAAGNAARGATATATYTTRSDGRYEFWVGSYDRLQTGTYTITVSCNTEPDEPPPPPPCTPTCTASANTACMLNDRFKVTLAWSDTSANLSGNGRIITYADNRPVTDPTHGEVSESTFWSMYAHNPDSVEALVRMIRGFDTYWVFVTGFASAEYTVTIQDMKSCKTWQRTVPTGSNDMIKDFAAFPFP